MAIVTTNNQNYIDIADAIRAKGVSGTFKPSEMANAITSISGGGSSGNGGVRFIDYDGETVEEWSADSVDSKTALPSNPTHEGLIGQGWNWSLESIKSYISKYPESTVNVGQMYKTASGLSEFDITLTKKTGLTVNFSMSGNKNWGDGIINTAKSHTYADYADYTITCDGVNLTSPTSDTIRRVRVGGNVTSIGSNAFTNCYGLSSITIPDGVTSIGNTAFSGCCSLSSITIPDGVITISIAVLSNCYALSSIIIPDGATSIGNDAFRSTYSLTSITIPDGVTSIGDTVFSNCYSLSSIIIPDGVTSIGSNVYSSCHSLTSIIIPDGVTTIGESAFNNCYALSSITIPDGVTSIGNNTFYNCYSLASIIIPDGVTSIGSNAFGSCYRIVKYDFSQVTSIPTLSSTSVFNYMRKHSKIVVPDALYDEWIAATNWSTYADYIYKASEVTD